MRVALLGTVLAAACSADDGAIDDATRIDDYRIGWHPSSCIMARARTPRLRICVRGNGNLDNARVMTARALEAWLVPLRERFADIATGVEFTCDRPDGTVNVYRGDGRAHAAPGVVLGIYDSRPYGSWVHEFGHAFACLGDTYAGGIAGRCQPGQPRSIMCYGLLLNNITEDDIAGVVHQAERLGFPRRVASPVTDAASPSDASSPPPPPPPPSPPSPPPSPPPPPSVSGCATSSSCGACTPRVGCGWCGAEGRCVSVDRDGLPAAACAGGFALSPPDCPAADGRTACGRYTPWTIWTCTDDRTRVRCREGSLEREVCARRCQRYPVGVDDRCE